MSFEPDIIVAEEDSPRRSLAVEARLDFGDRRQAESALRRYMLGMGVSTGLMVSPKFLAIFRDKFTSFSEESIAAIGTFDVPDKLFPSAAWLQVSDSISSREREFAFQRDVQEWLEELASTHVIREFSPEAREALAEHLLPALAGGVIRAAGPRELRAS